MDKGCWRLHLTACSLGACQRALACTSFRKGRAQTHIYLCTDCTLLKGLVNLWSCHQWQLGGGAPSIPPPSSRRTGAMDSDVIRTAQPQDKAGSRREAPPNLDPQPPHQPAVRGRPVHHQPHTLHSRLPGGLTPHNCKSALSLNQTHEPSPRLMGLAEIRGRHPETGYMLHKAGNHGHR